MTGREITITTAAELKIDFNGADIGGVDEVTGRVGSYADTNVYEVHVVSDRLQVSLKSSAPDIKKRPHGQRHL